MSKKKRLVANVSEHVLDELWKRHVEERISRSMIVDRILREALKIPKNPKTAKNS
jgi:hypothetical protein